ncbi:Zinc finger protein 704 [Acipenser ruthenus]|uniref:Zinc finger protein 704 n=1 Tax=Acipenser ruthenus TaxID=7906 RepID=A0A444V7C3_ACIRT|nr:Zinc finger protein 704 [Acipenser ruthenus]
MIEKIDGTNGSWKEGGFTTSSYSSSGYWSWCAPSDLSNPSTPSPPLSTDSCKPFRIPSQTDDGIDEADASDLLFNEPIPRKRKATAPVNIPGSASFTPSSSGFSISWQSPPVTFTGIPASPTHIRTHGFGEHRPQAHAMLSSPPRAAVGLRKSRGEGKKCRKVYGIEHRDMWCTACRWKKACQRFID